MKKQTNNAIPRLIRCLRLCAGWTILAAIPLSTLAMWFGEGFQKGVIIMLISLCFGAIFTGWLALGVWLITGAKYPPNVQSPPTGEKEA
jgi:O-antigen/teichoic acid export membrane protein